MVCFVALLGAVAFVSTDDRRIEVLPGPWIAKESLKRD
jgi:hypothetical protein